MKINMNVAPSFQGKLTIKTVKEVDKLGQTTYQPDVVTHTTKDDTRLMEYFMGTLSNVESAVPEKVEAIAQYFSNDIGTEISLPKVKMSVSLDLSVESELKQKVAMITERPQAGDTHVFYDSEV